MGYAEFHLSSDQKSSRSTTSEPIFELTESIRPHYFNVKSVSLPLTFCTMRRDGGVRMVVYNRPIVAAPALRRVEYLFEACKVNYTLSTFAVELQRLIQSENGDGIDCDFTKISVSVIGGRMAFTVTDEFSDNNKTIVFTLSGFIAEIANEQDDTDIELEHSIASLTKQVLSRYPWQIVPNYIYLHSNIMGNTTYGRQLRVEGGYKMGTVLAKIPIDFELVYGDQVQDWTNPSIDKSFMFSNNSEFNHLSFWFTDSKGTVLDFQGLPFALTLAMIL